MWNIKDTYCKIWKIEDKGKFAQVQLSTSRKDKESGEYINSSWSFVRFVGTAYKKISKLSDGDRIKVISAGVSREEYKDKDGERAWPKNPNFVVFDWESADSKSKDSTPDAPPAVEESEEQLPF